MPSSGEGVFTGWKKLSAGGESQRNGGMTRPSASSSVFSPGTQAQAHMSFVASESSGSCKESSIRVVT